MAKCPSGHEVPPQQPFCGLCGQPVDSQSPLPSKVMQVDDTASTAPEVAVTSSSDNRAALAVNTPRRGSFPKARLLTISAVALVILVIAGAIALVIVRSAGSANDTATAVETGPAAAIDTESSAGAGSSAEAPAPAASPTLTETPETTYADLVAGPLTTIQVCDAYSQSLKKFGAIIERREKALKGKGDNPYKAAAFLKGNAWVERDPVEEFDAEWEQASTTAFNAVSGGQAGQLDSIDDYLVASLAECGVESEYRQQRSKLTSIGLRQDAVVEAAAEKPWYPKGYTEWPTDSNVAFVYATFEGGDPCGYSACSYGRVKVVSEFGCPSGLYAEMNFVDPSGTVRDWSNDSVPYLGPGEQALLTFTSYSYPGGAGQIRLVDLSCY